MLHALEQTTNAVSFPVRPVSLFASFSRLQCHCRCALANNTANDCDGSIVTSVYCSQPHSLSIYIYTAWVTVTKCSLLLAVRIVSYFPWYVFHLTHLSRRSWVQYCWLHQYTEKPKPHSAWQSYWMLDMLFFHLCWMQMIRNSFKHTVGIKCIQCLPYRA